MPDPSASRDAVEAARRRLYRPGATPEDRQRYRMLDASSRPTEPVPSAVPAPGAVARARRAPLARRVALVGGVLGVLVGVGAVALGLQARSAVAPFAATPSPATTGLSLADVPAGWRLASLVRRDDAMTSGSSLRVDRSVTGGEFLLVIRCPAEDGRFRVVVTETGARFGGPWTGRCGPQSAVPLELEPGVGRVDVVITTRGDLPFAAAVVRRGSGSPRR